MPAHLSLSPALSLGNRMLRALPGEESSRLLASSETTNLSRGRVLHEAGDAVHHVYFLCSGMASLVCTTYEGDSIEVGMVGRDGVTGVPAILKVNRMPFRITVQIPGAAIKIEAAILKREFERGESLQHFLLCYNHALITQITQSVVCSQFHSLDQRLARWLLNVRDHTRQKTFLLTHEFMAQMTGAPRSGLTAVAGRLQKEGLIGYRRGEVRILNEQGLEAAACECYQVIRQSTDLCLPT